MLPFGQTAPSVASMHPLWITSCTSLNPRVVYHFLTIISVWRSSSLIVTNAASMYTLAVSETRSRFRRLNSATPPS